MHPVGTYSVGDLWYRVENVTYSTTASSTGTFQTNAGNCGLEWTTPYRVGTLYNRTHNSYNELCSSFGYSYYVDSYAFTLPLLECTVHNTVCYNIRYTTNYNIYRWLPQHPLSIDGWFLYGTTSIIKLNIPVIN